MLPSKLRDEGRVFAQRSVPLDQSVQCIELVIVLDRVTVSPASRVVQDVPYQMPIADDRDEAASCGLGQRGEILQPGMRLSG